MDAKQIKEFIIENNQVEYVLESIGCHSIKNQNNKYWTCGNFDGDNKQAITIYANNLSVINYTRQFRQPSDIITLIEYNKNINFFYALKWLHQLLNIDYYSNDEFDLPESLKITKMLISMKNKSLQEDDTPIKPIDPKILTYYRSYINELFHKDGITYKTMQEFQIGYDEWSNRITLPIFDETHTLVGVKGRWFGQDYNEENLKYIYLEPCPKSKILYGYHKTHEFIKQEGRVYVGEAEKFTMQLWSYGYKNCISLGGKKISKTQIQKLERLGVDIILALDKDVNQKELEDIAGQFIDGINVYGLIDDKEVLEPKQSPSDDRQKFEFMLKNCLYKLK